MQVRPFALHSVLKGYIEKIWTFTSSGPIADDDMRLIVPNGRLKLMVPSGDVTTVKLNGLIQRTKGDCITLVGLTDIPTIVNPGTGNPSGTIGIEFSPLGAYRFFSLNYISITNQMHPLTDILGKEAGLLQEQIANAADVETKISLLQEFLIRKFLQRNNEDPVFDHCIRKIRSSRGKISIRELEKETGYTGRWLNMKFLERAGLSPKNVSAIIRFDEFYRAMARDPAGTLIDREFYELYYDQSHFIRDFRRFTGLPPVRFSKLTNDFGKLYYKE